MNDSNARAIVRLDTPINVRCINNEFAESSLKIGKIYTIYEESKFTYNINSYGYEKGRFEIIKDEIINTNEYIHPTLDMIKVLLDNPTYQAEHNNQHNYTSTVNIGENQHLTYDDGDFLELIVNDDRKWKIIKPIVKVSFAEAYKICKKQYVLSNIHRRYREGYSNMITATNDEIDGDWTIEEV